ncbi:MAG: hypothetical protein IJ387_06005 [Thermoguttaceae bacterium]|nr:hypothetical protein [Thermoguttaceae bacterium]
MKSNAYDYRKLTRHLDAFDARIAAELETLRRDAARPERSRLTEKARKEKR